MYIEAEEKYFVGPRSLVFNLAHKSNKMLSLRDMTLAPLKGSVVSGVEIQDVDRALVFLDFAKTDIEDPEIVERIKQTWRSYINVPVKNDIEGYLIINRLKFVLAVIRRLMFAM